MTAWKATRPLWSVTTHAGHAMQSAPFTPSVMLLVSLLLLSHTSLLPSWLFYALSISSQTLFSFYLPSISAKLQWPILALTVSCCALRLHPSFALLCVVPFALLLLLALPLPGGSANSSTCTLLLSNGSPHQASSFSPLSSIKAHIEWSRLARSRGQTPQELAKSIKDDTDFHWDLPPCDTEGEALPLDPTQRESRRAKPEIGEVIRSWDRIVVWDADCVPFAVLESWRSLLDPVADAAVRAFLGTSSKSDPAPASCDPLTALAHLHLSSSVPSPQSARVDAAPSSAASAFFRDACRRPPRGAGAVSEAWYAAQAKGRGPTEKLDLLQQHSESCENVLPSIRAEQARGNHRQVLGPHEGIANADELQEELRVIAAGQDFFHRHGPPLLVSLLHAGLAGGFASPRIRRVLNSTGYLMNPASSKGSTKGGVPVSQASKDRTFRRLLETTEWILDVMEDVEALHLPTEVHAQRDAAAWLQTAVLESAEC
ncbi:hypothetical protein CBOM_02562 [Ceraceosorus bombacis]|uniref:Uncharacterized protein n=1 Tax=Ceraceosorus bombacis TaxID=401625 RepID=A0A0P1BFB2_9BASI|nr:hypothetical protein CBOM_02562 [Ceraceosorus bombacis]